MKESIQIIILSTFLLFSIGANAVTPTQSSTKSVAYESITKEKIYMYPPLEKYGLGIHYEINSIHIDWINAGNYPHLADIKKSLIQFIFGTNCADINTCAENFLKAGGEGYKDADKVPANAIEYYSKIEGTHIRSTEQVLVYKLYTEQYTGGAHGSYATRYFNYDLANDRQISLSDLFLPHCEGNLLSAICKNLCKKYCARSASELESKRNINLAHATVTDDFLLNSDGITFIYPLYSIAPYSEGEITVTIPLEDIKEYLTKDGLNLF